MFHVYIITNKPYGTLYTGVTKNLRQRIMIHREQQGNAFSARYNLMQLVYVEECISAYEAIRREKQLKSWKRLWKIRLIERDNPYWEDLSNYLM